MPRPLTTLGSVDVALLGIVEVCEMRVTEPTWEVQISWTTLGVQGTSAAVLYDRSKK